MTEGLYKFTGPGGKSCHGGTGVWKPGKWRIVRGQLVPCRRGLHLVRADQLIGWLAPELWRAEVEGETIAGNKIVARKARITSRVETWSDRTARHFAADCAERVLPLYEAQHPTDDRPRKAIETARRYADGQATVAELATARVTAGDAARDAAWDAARDAAWATARVTAGDAARDAAWDAARATARVTAGDAAWATARVTAWDAAWATARATAWATAWATEREWQSAHLLSLLGLEETK